MSSSEAFDEAFGDSKKQLNIIKQIENELFDEMEKKEDKKKINALQLIYCQICLN